ncbi:MAG: hypothetical protein WCB57_07400 [Pseudonocardiaceae bacterium]
MFSGRAKAARLAELDGFAAATWSRAGELKVVFAFTVEDGLIREIELIAGDWALPGFGSGGMSKHRGIRRALARREN